MAVMGQPTEWSKLQRWRPEATNTPTPLQNQYKLYNSAVTQQAGDYDNIMSGYDSALARANDARNAAPINPQTYNYSASPDVTNALNLQKQFAETGGYSDADKANLRARGVSPIRAVYQNANRDINRNVRLQGNISPNFNALKAKMAREQSQMIAEQAQNVEAGIAERTAQNKLAGGNAYSSAAQAESALRNQYGNMNTDRVNDANKFNATRTMQADDDALRALSGKTSLYGTTPALSRLFGDQAMQTANMEQDAQARTNNNAYSALTALRGRRM